MHKKIFLIIFILSYVFPVSSSELKIKINDLKKKIKALKEKKQDEDKYFNIFITKKNIFIKQKNIEIKNLKSDIKKLQLEKNKYDNKIKKIELFLNEQKLHNKEINFLISEICKSVINDIKTGIPFEKEKRINIVSSIIYDINNADISPSESFNRLFSFLSSEELLAYDSQTIKTILNISGKAKQGTLLRIGRIFFAFISENKIYLLNKSDNYMPKEIKSFVIKNNIQKAIDIITGKTPPEILDIPVIITPKNSSKE